MTSPKECLRRRLRRQQCQANNFYAVMAAKRFQTRTEEEIEQLLRDKSSKSTNKATLNAARTLRDLCKEQNLDIVNRGGWL